MCRASGGAQPAWKEMLGICRHHNPATETGRYLNDGGPRPEERAGREYPDRSGVREEILHPQAI